MSDQYPPPGSPPPPGSQPAPGGQQPPRWGPMPPPPGPGVPPGAPPPGWTPARGMLGAAHKPGAMPLRPLSLGEMYDAAFRIIRFNPKTTVGSAVMVAAVAMAIPVVVIALLTWTVGVAYDPNSSDAATMDDVAGLVGAYGVLLLGGVLQSIGLIFVTGMIAHVTAAAAIGKRLSLGEAWAATLGKRWRLVGLAFLLGLVTTLLIAVYVVLWVLVIVVTGEVLLVVLWGLVSVPAFLAFMCWFWIRVYYLPVPALMLEPVGVLGAIGRGWRLTSRSFWRTFGIALLTVLIAGVAGQMLAFPVSLIGTLGSLAVDVEYALLVTTVGTALAQVVSTAFVAPFSATVTSLQYLDQRMRKEAYDVELMSQAGVLRS